VHLLKIIIPASGTASPIARDKIIKPLNTPNLPEQPLFIQKLAHSGIHLEGENEDIPAVSSAGYYHTFLICGELRSFRYKMTGQVLPA